MKILQIQSLQDHFVNIQKEDINYTHYINTNGEIKFIGDDDFYECETDIEDVFDGTYKTTEEYCPEAFEKITAK